MNYSRIFLGMGICLCLLLTTACFKLPDFHIWYFNLGNEEIWVEVHGFSPMASPGRLMPNRDTDRLSSKEMNYSDSPPIIDDVITISWSKTEDGPKKEVKINRNDYGIPRRPWYGRLTVVFTAARKWELKYDIEKKHSDD